MLKSKTKYAHSSSDASTKRPYDHSTMAMTVDEMANELRISLPNAYNLVKQEHFPAFKIGNRILIDRQGLQSWIADRWKTPCSISLE